MYAPSLASVSASPKEKIFAKTFCFSFFSLRFVVDMRSLSHILMYAPSLASVSASPKEKIFAKCYLAFSLHFFLELASVLIWAQIGLKQILEKQSIQPYVSILKIYLNASSAK